MGLSKASRNQATSKHSRTAHVAGGVKVEAGSDHIYGITANTSYNSKLRNLNAKPKAFNEASLIVLTINPELDKVASPEKPNAKAEAAKQMFADYRNKK
jgi:hypothetical protein